MILSKWSTGKLKSKYQSLHRFLVEVECFGIKDLILLGLIERELNRRNINVQVDSVPRFEKT